MKTDRPSIQIIFTAALILMTGCLKDLFSDDQLSLQRRPYTGDELRMDGFYYHNYGDDGKSIIYFFYRNGVLFHGGAGKDENDLEVNMEKARKIKFMWGVFNIINDTIIFERWVPSERPYHAYVYSGRILNDTTFVITEAWRSNRKRRTLEKMDETYHFRQFSPKPDSTNVFVP